MSETAQNITIDEIVKSIDIPDSAYETAEKRYQDLGKFFSSSRATCSQFSPHIYPQGSFRLGTVIRPIDEGEQYDLDMGCRLQYGITRNTFSQKQLKDLVGSDLEIYRNARRIQDEVEEKHRCWCLNYRDDLSFHMDVVPSLPAQEAIIKSLNQAMLARGTHESLASSVASHAGAITDNRLPHYAVVDSDWPISNSVGYAIWFEDRMNQVFAKSFQRGPRAQIDAVPMYQRKTPLQKCVQILKRHRDTTFSKDQERKPASIIITTLAAMAYQGESDVADATRNVLQRMGDLVQPFMPRIPNPINPQEDFADRWYTPNGLLLQLEDSFWGWLDKAKADIGALSLSDDVDYLLNKSVAGFTASMDPDELQRRLHPQSRINSPIISSVVKHIPHSPVDTRGGGRFG